MKRQSSSYDQVLFTSENLYDLKEARLSLHSYKRNAFSAIKTQGKGVFCHKKAHVRNVDAGKPVAQPLHSAVASFIK
jgi:hypothetical protein